MTSSMNLKPLTYPASKCVLQYMEANLRIQLAQRLPAIKAAEKSAPLKIDYLRIEPFTLKINETKYRVGVIRTCELDWLLDPHSGCHEDGEQCDVDAYGETDRTYSEVVTPGDILMKFDVNLPDEPPVNVENELRRLLIHKGVDYLDGNVEAAPARPAAHPEEQEEDEGPFRDVFDPRVDLLVRRYDMVKFRQFVREKLLNRYQASLLTKHLREENAISPFKNYLQFTVKDGVKKKEHLVYEKKIHEAMKYLMNKIFEERHGIINAKNYRAYNCGGVLRLPEGFQLRIQNLQVCWSIREIMSCLNPVIDKSSFPLNSLDLSGCLPRHLQLPFVGNARKLMISNHPRNHNLFGNIIQLRNREVHWTPNRITNEEVIRFIRNWLEHPRGVGTLFVFKFLQTKIDEMLFQMVKSLPGAKVIEANDSGCKSFPHSVTFPIGITSELRISVEKMKEENEVIKALKFEELERLSMESQ